jgi:hypothetical protein
VKTTDGRILQDGWTMYKASKEYNIPLHHILNERMLSSPPAKEVPTPKRGMPVNVTSEDEIKLSAR